MPSETPLPTDIAELQARVLAAEAALAASEEARARLERMLASLRHAAYGARSEKRDPDQRNLPLEDLEIAEGMLEAAEEKARATLQASRPSPSAVNRNKGHLPAHLPRVEEVIEPGSTACPCGCGEMTRVGEDRTERLDVVPARLRVLVTVRPKYICRACAGRQSAQAPAPEFLVPRGLATEALVARTMVAKFADHMPFYRQAEAYRREGLELDRSMLANWAGRAAGLLEPVVDRLVWHLERTERLFVDETTVPVLAPGTGKVRKDFLWAVVRDDRGHGGADPPIVVFHHSRSRSGETARDLLRDHRGRILQVDGYQGYDSLADPAFTQRPWEIACCWVHWRRRFVEFSRTTASPICEAVLERIATLYRIEATVRGRPPEERLKARRALSAPIVEALRPWLEAQLERLPSGSDLARHIRYALKRWTGLTRFLEDGRIELDTNPVENAIRPVPLTRKNALFAGNDDGARTWARCASLIGTAKLNGVNPEAYIATTLRRLLDGHMRSDIDALMPWTFTG